MTKDKVNVDGVNYVREDINPGNPNLAEIAVILDRSGSMSSIRADMEGGFKTFIKEQREADGECIVSLYQFDNKYDVVYEGKPIAEVEGLSLVPRGGTALLDAVGRSLANITERHAKLEGDALPGAVVVLVITDGGENSSREMSLETVKQGIKDAETRGWQLVFMAADMDAFNDAHSLGFDAGKMGLVGKTAAGIDSLYSTTSRAIGAYRSATASFTGEGELPEIQLNQEDLED